MRFHDLRHTSATLLINQGVHAKTIAGRLGHADIRTQ
ncbi:tyrosine-type recombinase/integrase [Cohnella sp. GbtcB17]